MNDNNNTLKGTTLMNKTNEVSELYQQYSNAIEQQHELLVITNALDEQARRIMNDIEEQSIVCGEDIYTSDILELANIAKVRNKYNKLNKEAYAKCEQLQKQLDEIKEQESEEQ